MDAKPIDTQPERPVDPGHTSRARPSGGARRPAEAIDVDDWIIGSLAVVAAVVATFADCEPTTWGPADAALTAGFAAVTTLAASKARRWTWLVAAGTAGFLARSIELQLCAGVAVLIAVYAAAFADRRSRVLGAIVGATSVQVLLRLPDLRFSGLTALLAAAALAPVWVSGYRLCRRRTKRQLRRVGFVVAGLLLAATAGLAVAALDARNDTQTAVGDMRTGLDSARAGKQDDAANRFRAARESFASANQAFSSWFARPARLVPVLSQHLRAARIMAASGEDLAGTAQVAATTARYEDLRTSGGQVNLPLVASMQAPVGASVDSLRRAQAQLDEAPSEWLLPVLADPLADFRHQVGETLPEAEGAADALRSVPPILGAKGPRRYFLAFGTPSESRGMGGFIGGFGELTVVDGKVELTRSGSIKELSERQGADDRSLSKLDEYLSRYGRFRPARFLQNTSASPDFPTVAEALRQLYPQAGGAPVDGVIYVDPDGIAALLRITGPVTVEGLDHPLTSDNAAGFLLRDQYVDFPAKNGAEGRDEMLVRATKATFQALTSRSLPGPRTIIDALAPAVAQHRIQFEAFDPADHAFLDRLHVTGSFPPAGQGDFFSFRTSNGGADKIDAYLERAIDYRVRYDPSTATTDITATVTLRNTAPASGLPDYVIGNTPTVAGQPPEPKGTSVLDFSAYTDGMLQDATRDGAPLPVQSQIELGHHVWSNRVVIPPGGSTTLVFHLLGRTEGGRYHLDVSRQPVVGPDRLSVQVDVAPGWTVTRRSGWPDGLDRVSTGADGAAHVGASDPVDQQQDVALDVGVTPASSG